MIPGPPGFVDHMVSFRPIVLAGLWIPLDSWIVATSFYAGLLYYSVEIVATLVE